MFLLKEALMAKCEMPSLSAASFWLLKRSPVSKQIIGREFLLVFLEKTDLSGFSSYA